MALLLLCLSPLAIGACSSAQLAYRNADWLLVSYADDLVDLRDAQETAWEPVVDAVMARHRERELPTLVALLRSAERGVKEGLSAGELACLRDRGRAAIARNAAMLAEAAAPLLASLEPAQLDYLGEQLAERDREYVEDHLDPDLQVRHEGRVERMIRRIERWTGRMGAQQRALVERHVASWPKMAERWAEYRRERQQAMFELLRGGAEPAVIETFLAGWWGRQAGMPATMKRDRREMEAGVIEMILALQDSLGAQQRRHLAGEVGDVRRSLAGLVPEAAIAAAEARIDCTTAAPAPA